MTNNTFIAFLDLLAFSPHVRENTDDALRAFDIYSKILESKRKKEQNHPISTYSHPDLQSFEIKRAVSSFDCFLPFSDSIFISSSDPNVFLKQLGSFILHCFNSTLKVYSNSSEPNNPIKLLRSTSGMKTIEENRYPTLFRGGIAMGEVIPISLMGIVNGKATTVTNLAGKAVIEAVNLEDEIDGPRVFLKKDVFEKLDAATKIYVAETEKQDVYELLWPCFYYNLEEGYVYNSITGFHFLLLQAVSLWKASTNSKYLKNYWSFVELVIRGTLKVFAELGQRERAIGIVQESIFTFGIVQETNHLLEPYIC